MSMITPSGAIFDTFDIAILNMMVQYGFITYGTDKITLKSGKESYLYVYGREDITTHPEFQWAIGKKIAELVKKNAEEMADNRQQCLIGVPTAGTMLAQAATMVNWQQEQHRHANSRIIHQVMREQLKNHGEHPSWLNGKLQPDLHTNWLLENVVTTAGSILEAKERLQQSGNPALDISAFVLVDRQYDGIAKMEQAGFNNIVVAYKVLDIAYGLVQLGLWSPNNAEAIEREIQS